MLTDPYSTSGSSRRNFTDFGFTNLWLPSPNGTLTNAPLFNIPNKPLNFPGYLVSSTAITSPLSSSNHQLKARLQS